MSVLVQLSEKPLLKCAASSCDRRAKIAGYCATHYQRHRLGQDIDAPIGKHSPVHDPLCAVEGCNREYKSRGFCEYHYNASRTLPSRIQKQEEQLRRMKEELSLIMETRDESD